MLFSLISECNDGHFGLNCRGLCSGHCESNDPCDHVSGVCSDGCQDGYMDAFCNSCKKLTSLFVKLKIYTLYCFLCV